MTRCDMHVFKNINTGNDTFCLRSRDVQMHDCPRPLTSHLMKSMYYQGKYIQFKDLQDNSEFVVQMAQRWRL